MTPPSFGRYLAAIEAEMRRAVACEEPLLARMMRYHLGWEDAEGRPDSEGSGKALRPVLCLLTCEALCGSPDPALPAAAAIEILHNFSLVHDDIQDGDRTRRGRATAWAIWGIPQAINAGDGLWAVSTRTLLRAVERDGVSPEMVLRAMQMLNDASLTMIEGQALDIGFETQEHVTEDEYLDMIARKTGALIARSISIGAVFGGASPEQLPAFERYGNLIGRIFQVRDDVLGIWGEEAVTGKSTTSDIRRKKQSLPIVYALSRNIPAARDLAAIYALPELDHADVARAVSLLDETGARHHADHLAETTFAAATEALATLPLREDAKRELDEMGRFLLTRDR
ncbi:MAG: polyprenyl synthetase family protein [Dehalococcoidia bacterium]